MNTQITVCVVRVLFSRLLRGDHSYDQSS